VKYASQHYRMINGYSFWDYIALPLYSFLPLCLILLEYPVLTVSQITQWMLRVWLSSIGCSTVCHYFYSVRHWGWGWGLPSSEWHHMVPWAVPWPSPASTGTSPLWRVLTALLPANPTDQPCGKATVPPPHAPLSAFSTALCLVLFSLHMPAMVKMTWF